MKISELRATLGEFGRLFKDCGRPTEADVLRQLETFLEPHGNVKVLSLAKRIRESRSTSGRNSVSGSFQK
jgi:hypothetical protein